MHRLWVIACLVVLLFGGCGDSNRSNRSSPPTPAQWFNATHGGKTVTPHGVVVAGSAIDLPDGRVEYRTSYGSRFRVRVMWHADGGYLSGTPEEVTTEEPTNFN